MRTRFSLAILALALLAGRPSAADEFHYVLIFGADSHPKQLRHAHTFAVFVRAVGQGPDADTYALEQFTLGWCPATQKTRVWAVHPEPGVNLDLPGSLAFCAQNRADVTLFGPYRISPLLYASAVAQYQKLATGSELYRAIDPAWDSDVSDCIHAVTDIDYQFGRRHYPLLRTGRAAATHIAQQFELRSPYVRLNEDHSWLIPRLGLDRYPLTIVPPGSVRLPLISFQPAPSLP